MATLEELIERIREAAGDHPAFDKVDTAIGSSSVTTLELKLGEHSPVGTLIHTKKFETMLVTDKPSLRTHTVERGWNGTTKATSYAVGDIVFSGGRHSYHRYRRAVNEALGAITFAFGKPTWDSTQSFGSSKRIIEVPAAAIRMFDLATKPSGVTDLEPVAYRFLRSVPTAISSTGRGARLLSGNPGSGTAYIGYEVIWPTLTNLIDVLDAAYPADTEDLIEDGAVA